MNRIWYSITLLLFSLSAFSQSTNDILNLLVQKKAITQEESDSLRADAAIKQQETDAKKKSFPLNASKAFQLSGYTHIRYQHFDLKGSPDGFDVRRARLTLKGSITPYWSYYIQPDFAVKGSPKLIDAYADWKIWDFLVITIGQFKVPLSLENYSPDNIMETLNRSQVVEALAGRSKDVIGDNNGRDIGAQISGSFLKLNDLPLVDYKFGVFNGAGINITGDNNQFKDIAGRLVIHPIKGIDLGSSVYHGLANYGDATKNVKATDHNRNRVGADISIEYSGVSIKAEYLQGKDSSSVRRSGYYVQAGYYVLPQKLEFLVKYDTYNPNTNKDNNYFTDYIAGLNFNISSYSRIQFAYDTRREKLIKIKNNFAVLQLQIGF